MARNNGGIGTLDLGALAASFAERQKRLTALSKVQKDIGKRRTALDREQADLEREISALTGSGTATPARQPRPAKVAKGNGTKKASKPRAAKSPKAAKVAKGNGGPKLTTESALLTVFSPDEVISKEEAFQRVNKAGLKRNKVVVGQTLGASNFFLNPSRGMWKLSAAGVKAQNKANGSLAPAATKSVASDTAPSTPAPAAPQTDTTGETDAPAPAQPA